MKEKNINMEKKPKIFQTELKSLPPNLIVDGKTYDLIGGKCNESSKMFSNWWWYKYVDSSKNPDMPIQAADNSSMYYLCAMQETKEKAIADMLERLNSMVEIVTEETLEKEKKAWEKLKKEANKIKNKK